MKKIIFISLIFIPSFGLAVPFESQNIVISAPSHYAVESGVKTHRAGGNVVDVAVNVALVLSVTSPYYAGLGGGGFAVVKMGANDVMTLNFREVAPQGTSRDFFKDKSSKNTGSAVGVPGIPAGLWELHKQYGKLPWKYLFQEPLKLAEKGFRVSGEWVLNTKRALKYFNFSGRKIFLKNGGEHYKPGEIFRQKRFYQALNLFKKNKSKGFYHGPVSWDIVETAQKEGGVLQAKDLKDYKTKWLPPLIHRYKEYTLYFMPPPSSGGVVLSSGFHLLEHLEEKMKNVKKMSHEEFHYLGEILSRSFRGRSYLGDPEFNENPVSYLLSPRYLRIIANSILPERSRKLFPLKISKKQLESPETTHFSVMDKIGNSVSMTLTLNRNFGSGVVTKKYGIVLNNEMDDFTTKASKPNMYGLIQGKANIVEPKKTPLSSMSPTLVEKNGNTIISLGASGGPRIISSVFQTLYRMLLQDMNIDQAINSPRVHHQYEPHILFVQGLQYDVIKNLKRKQHVVKEGRVGRVLGVSKDIETGFLNGAFDSGGEGSAGGY